MDDVKSAYLDLAKNRPVKFGIEAGFKDLTLLNNEWIKTFLFNSNDFTLQAHRGSYKSTCLNIAMALFIVLFPNLTMIFTRKTDMDIREAITTVSTLLNTQLFQELSQALWGKEIILNRSTTQEINTNLKLSPGGASQLTGFGIKGSMTGKHADIIITDDIVNLQDRISPADRERTKLAYRELQNIKNRGVGLLIVEHLGTKKMPSL